MATTMSRKQRIFSLIKDELNPIQLVVEDESYKHHVPEGAETHFKILIVSEQFKDLTRVVRHRIINKLLAEELNNGLHALSLQLHSPDEWESSGGALLDTPACRDGYRHG